MRNFFKLLPWGLLVIAGIVIWAVLNRNSAITEVKGIVDSVKPKTDLPLTDTFKDALGSEHSVFQNDVNKVSKDFLKSTNRPPNIIDTAAKNQKVAASELDRVTQINFRLKADSLKAQKKIDQLTKLVAYYEYSDKYVKLRYTPPKLTDSIGAGTFDFSYDADLTISQYQKRKWFLAAKKSYIDISSKDIRTTIMGVKQLTVEQKTPQFGLRVQATANFNPQTNALGIGPAVRVDLGRFSVQGNYLYYPESSRWRPGIIGNYDLIRF